MKHLFRTDQLHIENPSQEFAASQAERARRYEKRQENRRNQEEEIKKLDSEFNRNTRKRKSVSIEKYRDFKVKIRKKQRVCPRTTFHAVPLLDRQLWWLPKRPAIRDCDTQYPLPEQLILHTDIFIHDTDQYYHPNVWVPCFRCKDLVRMISGHMSHVDSKVYCHHQECLV